MENNENIMDLYDQYLDAETLEQIRIEDEEEDEKKNVKVNKKKRESMFTKEDTITIDTYVRDYLGIHADCSRLWHSGLKELGSPFVVGVDNEFANEHPERVLNGDLLLVMDGRGNRGTYINPDRIRLYLETGDIGKAISIFQKKGVRDLKLLDDYWYKCLAMHSQLEVNNNFLQLLIDTNKTKKIERLKEQEVLYKPIDTRTVYKEEKGKKEIK